MHAEANLSREGSIRRAGKASAASTGWRLDERESPGGAIAHLGIHRLDSFVQLFGEIDRVFAQACPVIPNAPFADSVNVLVRFRSGMTGYLGSSLSTTLNSRFQVFGSQGWVELRGPSEMHEYLRTSLRSLSMRLNDGQADTREFDAVDSVKLNFEAFADAIEGKAPYPVPVDEMIHVVAVVEAVARSLETGQPVLV
jgi:predicted dehydrogenase